MGVHLRHDRGGSDSGLVSSDGRCRKARRIDWHAICLECFDVGLGDIPAKQTQHSNSLEGALQREFILFSSSVSKLGPYPRG
jgi:hypothetical protein